MSLHATVLDPVVLSVIAVIFLAVFTQSLTGFGSGLVSMALLPPLLGIRTAAPLVALMAATLELVLLIRYRGSITLTSVWRLVAGALVGIPIGILVLRRVDERITLTLLGIVLFGYALYCLLNFRLPQLRQPNLAYVFGLAAGLLGGAYNTSGPPVIIYGDTSRWSPGEFKGNLQTFFIINDIIVISSHALSQNLTELVWQNYLWSLPAIVAGIVLGLLLDRVINPALFRKLILLLLLVLSLRLLFF